MWFTVDSIPASSQRLNAPLRRGLKQVLPPIPTRPSMAQRLNAPLRRGLKPGHGQGQGRSNRGNALMPRYEGG